MRIERRPLPEHAPPSLPGLHPVLERVYRARGVSRPEELDYRLARLPRHDTLLGIREAVDLLVPVVREGARALVVGDYDADGATSTAVTLLALRAMGARAVEYLVPNRLRFGYGLTPEIVALAAERRPRLIITVDNGISSHEGVQAARERGIRVLVTDHHLPPGSLPGADAIVNPNRPGDPFPAKSLAGVGVAFYVMLALRAHLREQGWIGRGPNLGELLDLVALGTVADVVALDPVNRILVAAGLERIRRGRARPGIEALLRAGGREPARVTAADLGFVAGPRLNAAGRLDDMSLGIECLLADDRERARAGAATLDALNRERRRIEAGMQEEALVQAARVLDPSGEGGLASPAPGGANAPAPGLCLHQEGWHPGVVGIVAGRVRERTHRPVVAFARDRDGTLKGSARSIAGLHIRDVLESVAGRIPEVVLRFGGHAMAAGLSIRGDGLDRFREHFVAVVGERVSPEDLSGCILSDGPLAPGELGLELARLIREGGPWGQGFPEPVFDGLFRVLEARVVGERHLRLRVHPLPGDSPVLGGIAFNQVEAPAGASATVPAAGAVLRLAYRLSVNLWQGVERPELVIEHWERAAL